jgi:hypothetical protein
MIKKLKSEIPAMITFTRLSKSQPTNSLCQSCVLRQMRRKFTGLHINMHEIAIACANNLLTKYSYVEPIAPCSPFCYPICPHSYHVHLPGVVPVNSNKTNASTIRDNGLASDSYAICRQNRAICVVGNSLQGRANTTVAPLSSPRTRLRCS